MVMTWCQHSSSVSILLLVLLSIHPQLLPASPVPVESSLRSSSSSRSTDLPQLPQPEHEAHGDNDSQIHTRSDQSHNAGIDTAQALTSILLEALDNPGWEEDSAREQMTDPYTLLEFHQDNKNERGNGGVAEQVARKNQNIKWDEKRSVKEGNGTPAGQQFFLLDLLSKKISAEPKDNEILPPLKGYKAYNQQLAQATKKLKWLEAVTKTPQSEDRNFMDDFENSEEDENADEVLTNENERVVAKAEQEEVRRQEAEALAAREEEQRLADIASDMLLEYMDRKQQETSYLKQRKKGSVAEDKRSNEVVDDDDDDEAIDPQTIDRLIEISSKLHLPADDVVEIIADVEEKKKKKDSPPVIAPRFRPLVAPPRVMVPAVSFSKPPKKSKGPHSIDPYKKKAKAKLYQQDLWFKPQPFLAYPSYPYYQKPYRAYYPVYFPPPKSQYFNMPVLSYDYKYEDTMDYGFKPPKRRNRVKGKGRGWKQVTVGPPNPYISNYILPHPRTYQSLPMSSPITQSDRRQSPFYDPPDYGFDEMGVQQDGDEELENFIEKIYFHRRMF
uniref:Uncharacterized protein n=1 Tax=Denticeps clupeoides TaxID=299321 RepID=A0AAY4EUF9_9TELE